MKYLFNFFKILSICIYMILLSVYFILHSFAIMLKGSDFNPTLSNIVIDVLLLIIPSILLFFLVIVTIKINELCIKYSMYAMIISISFIVLTSFLVFVKYTNYKNIISIFLSRYYYIFLLVFLASIILFLFNSLLTKKELKI